MTVLSENGPMASRARSFPLEPYYNTLEYRRGRLTSWTSWKGKANARARADLRTAAEKCPRSSSLCISTGLLKSIRPTGTAFPRKSCTRYVNVACVTRLSGNLFVEIELENPFNFLDGKRWISGLMAFQGHMCPIYLFLAIRK